MLRDGISMVPKLPFQGFPRLTYQLLMGNLEDTNKEILRRIVRGNTGGSSENANKKLISDPEALRIDLLGKKLQILAPKSGFLKLALGCTFDCESLFRKMAPNCLKGVRMA